MKNFTPLKNGCRLLLLLVLGALLPTQANAALYATGGGVGALSGLWSVDPFTGASTFVWGFPSIHIYAGGLAYDAATDTLYATGAENSSTGTSRLFTINRSTGATTAFAGLSSSINLSSGGLAINPLTGVMYATGGFNDGVHAFQSTGLFTIDKTTGAATLVGFAGGNCCTGDFGIMLSGLGFRSDGTLFANGYGFGPSYLDQSSHLYTVDLATGAATNIGSSGITLGRSLQYSGLAFQNDGTLLSMGSLDAASGTLYSVNTANGAATSLNSGTGYATGPIHFGVDGGLTFAPLPVNYPSVNGIPAGAGTVDISIISPVGASFAVLPTVVNGGPIAAGINFPVGTISFTAQLPAGMAGGDATMLFRFTPPLTQNFVELYKVDYGGNIYPIDHARWVRADTATSTFIKLTLTDGLFPLDLDATANGLIVDPVAIGVVLNQPPIANAGPDQNIYLGQTALLSGAASSDANGDPLTYAWTLDAVPLGSSAVLVGATTMTPSLTPDVAGIYHLSLVVNDGQVDSAASPMTVTVSLNLPPVAIATGTPVTGNAPLPVVFNAAASYDPEGSALTYRWNFGDPASGASNLSTLSGPIHTYTNAGNYTAVVTVTDNLGKTDQASVIVTVMAPNLSPVVLPMATPNNGTAFLEVHFSANATDVNPGDVLTYSWDFGDPTSGASNSSTLANPLHTYYSAGTYTATVAVSDGVNPPVSASLTISVSSALTIHVTEAKIERGERGKVEGRISMKANFDYAGTLTSADIIRVKFDGVTLLEVPFGSFKQESSGVYEYETRTQKAEIDFYRKMVKVSRHKMLTSGVDNSNGIDVEVNFGAATGTDHVDMTGEKDKRDRDSDLSHKE